MITILDFYSIFQKSTGVTIDSRAIKGGEIFFAFSGQNYNAATMAIDAIEKGALAVIVEDKRFAKPEKNIFYVSSTLHFLQKLASFHREKLNIPIIALTGSNGKTTTKELIHAVLSQKFSVQYTKGNLNNHIGVPLTLLSICPEHQIAVVEMGANHQKEIEFLCEITKPDFGYITNFGKAHLEGFGGFDGVIKGKSEMYNYLISNEKKIFINENDEIQVEKTKGYFHNVISFGKSTSNYNFESFMKDNCVGISFENHTVVSNLTGEYNFTNLCAATAIGLYFGVDFSKIQNAISNYEPTNMRSQIVKKGSTTLVLDTYNANPSSMMASLKNFNEFKGSKIAIIGDMLELGEESYEEHNNVLQFARSLDIDKVITVGENFMQVNDKHSFKNVSECIEYIKSNPILVDNILLKGSRGMAMENILPVL